MPAARRTVSRHRRFAVLQPQRLLASVRAEIATATLTSAAAARFIAAYVRVCAACTGQNTGLDADAVRLLRVTRSGGGAAIACVAHACGPPVEMDH